MRPLKRNAFMYKKPLFLINILAKCVWLCSDELSFVYRIVKMDKPSFKVRHYFLITQIIFWFINSNIMTSGRYECVFYLRNLHKSIMICCVYVVLKWRGIRVNCIISLCVLFKSIRVEWSDNIGSQNTRVNAWRHLLSSR